IIERLIRAGVYMGPLNMALCAYGGGTLGRNPFDLMHFLQRVPQGSVNTFWSSMRGLISISAMAIVLGQHVRVGNEDNLWGADRTRKTTVEQIEGVVRICKAFGRRVATAEEARRICKVGVWYNSVEETLQKNGMPPNPTEFNPGFLTWPTDGKKAAPVIAGDSHPIAACMNVPDPVRAAQAKIMANKK
ncbi:MAG TPA: 3-keto-5-aminohexanoate cleavage protein, partial [Verrucomicrobiae bacterium]|nr:3-keto-5-aminohexanoate cleavage protein [Verrucomicrobiae bacterium]